MTDLAQLTAGLGPNATIGIIGGGQLGRMLAVSAARLGYSTIVLEPGKDCPAAQVCNRQIVAEYDDTAALDELIGICDVITYEFENVPLSAAAHIDRKRPLYPPARALEVAQDRLVEKQFLETIGVTVAPYHNVESVDDLVGAVSDFGGGILKTRRFGYDGKGQIVLSSATIDDPQSVLAELGNMPCVLEKKIDFSSEFSIIAARSVDGETCYFDPATNVHEGGILRRSTVPANLVDSTIRQAGEISQKITDALGYVGVIGIEFFETPDGVLVNEIAPRVHNSGHWTREACVTSQFEQHIRAIAGLPMGAITRTRDCEMINLIGDEGLDIRPFLGQNDVHPTLYGKAEARPGRKMGHVTRLL